MIVELHPGGGGHDVLSIRQGVDQQAAVFSRTGTLQASGLELNWADVLRLGTAETTERVLKAAGLRNRRRPTTPVRRTYRMIAEVLQARLPDQQPWIVCSAMSKTAGSGARLQPQLLLGQPDLALADPYQVWTLLRDGVPVLALKDGSAVYPDGYRLTLMEAPSTAERPSAHCLLRRIVGE
jgi:hypothetical protein